MAQTVIKNATPTPPAPAVLVDEELWFGTGDNDAAERAAANSMAAAAGKIVGAKPFPESARKLAELSSNDATPVQEYVRVIEHDPALSARLLRIVNSAGFSLRQRCTSVRHAVTILGSKHLHRLATTAAVLDLFDEESGAAVQVLEHSAAVAALSRELGSARRLPIEDLFAIGMLHDIGKLMMLDAFGERYQRLLEQTSNHADTLHLLEREEFGFDHGVLAAHVLKAWAIPEPIPKIVAWHHEPARAYRSSTIHASMVQTVRLADSLVHAISRGATRDEISVIAKQEAASYLDIPEAQLAVIWDKAKELYAHAVQHQDEQDGDGSTRDSESRVRLRSEVVPAHSGNAEQLVCAECGDPSFGATCPACKGELCARHPVGPAGWCNLCAQEYTAFEAATKLPTPKLTLWVSLAALLVAAIVARVHANHHLAPALTGALLLAAFAAAALVIGKRSYLRARFLRTRPQRQRAALRA